ncbi:MAG TPA: class I SAM-dependent methyltransferase [Candidatus Limnocylindrales bacterium]|nr:class I SAM-dependent methyltransferase [Candidatus Limnocylindrales bacterium]
MSRNEPDSSTLATIFDRIPYSYDRYRPGYAPEAIEALVELSRAPNGGDVLEIGAGTGKLTVPLAKRGFVITAIEPGQRMADLLAKRVRRWPSVRITRSTFEDASVEPCSFDLVVAATSFHWLDPDRRYDLAADALRPGGSIGLIRNDHVAVPSNRAYIEGVRPIYERRAPELLQDLALPMEDDPPGFADEVEASGRFEGIEQRQFAWDQRFTAVTLSGMLGTHSEHRALPRRRRAALLRDIRQFVETELGGAFLDRYVTTVCVGRVE